MKISYYVAIIFSVMLSCKSQNVEKRLILCVNNKINKYHYSDKKEYFDFYSFIKEIEGELILFDLIKNKSLSSYEALFESVVGSESKEYDSLFIKVKTIFDKYEFQIYRTDILFNQCPHEVAAFFKDEKKSSNLFKKGSDLYEIMEGGYVNKQQILNGLSKYENQEFEQIVYRAPYILLVVINLDINYKKNKFNSSSPKSSYENE